MPARRAHEPAELTLNLRREPDGALTFSVPTCPGWAFTARRPQQIGEAIVRCYQEAAIAAYARLRGVAYDVAAETDEEELPAGAYTPSTTRHPEEPEPAREDEVAKRRRTKHPRTHPPEEWVELGDGYWRSPGGGRYRPDSRQVRTVVASLGRPGGTR
jgi:hypothetical protein